MEVHTKSESFLSKIRQGLRDDPKMVDELSIIAGQTKESPKITNERWCWPILNGLYLGQIGGQT